MTTELSQQIQTWRDSGALTPEARLLLAAARAATGDDKDEEWMAVLSRGEIAWEKLLAAVEDHGLRPLLWRLLGTTIPDSIPPKILDDLRQSFQANLGRNLELTGELWKILRLFAEHGIAAVPFKGPTLAVLAYGDLAWRQFNDLDVLVDRADLARAGELLQKRGYQPEVDLSATREKSFLSACTALSFRRPEIRCLVELHWELSPRLLPFDLSCAEIRERPAVVYPGGKQMMTLSPEDLLLYLCAHGARHCWNRLGWIADVSWLIRRHPRLDWIRVLENADRLRSERVLFIGLLLANELLGADLPPEVKRRAQADRAANNLAAQIVTWLLQSDSAGIGMITQDLFYLRFQDGWREKLRYLLRLVAAPNMADWIFLPLPNSLTFLYPLTRPFRLIKTRTRMK